MDTSLALKWLDGAFFSGVLLHIGAHVHRRVRTGGGAWHVHQGDPAAWAPAQKGLAQEDLEGCFHVKIELHLLLFVCLSSASAGVAGIEQHLVLAIGGCMVS